MPTDDKNNPRSTSRPVIKLDGREIRITLGLRKFLDSAREQPSEWRKQVVLLSVFWKPIVLLDMMRTYPILVGARLKRRRRTEPHKPMVTATPPKIAEFVLYLFLNRTDRMAIPGDLAEELSTTILPRFGRRAASIWYWNQVFWTVIYRNRLCRWFLVGGGVYKIASWLTRIGG